MAGIARRNRLLEYPTCVDCLFHSRRLLDEESLRRIALRTRSRTQLFVESFKETGENLDGRRRQLNEKYLKLVPHLKPLLDDVARMLALSALGNSLDHNMRWWGDEGVELDEGLSRMLGQAVVDPRAVEALRSAGSVALLLDNSGEAVIDLVVGIRLAQWGKEVAFVSRKEVYEIDVDHQTVVELFHQTAERLGAGGGAEGRIRFLTTGDMYPAPASPSLPEETRRFLEEADLVISKGIANAEALLDTCSPPPQKTIVALTAKCPPIARVFGVQLGTPVARLGYPCGLTTRIVG